MGRSAFFRGSEAGCDAIENLRVVISSSISIILPWKTNCNFNFFFHLDILGINSLATSDLLGEVDIRARVKIQQRCYLAARPA